MGLLDEKHDAENFEMFYEINNAGRKSLARQTQNPPFNWPAVSAAAFYGKKNELNDWLERNTKNVQARIAVASSTQARTHVAYMQNLELTTYELISKKNRFVYSAITNFHVGTNENFKNREEYGSLMAKYTGLFALHHYMIKKFDEQQKNPNEYVRRYHSFSSLLNQMKALINHNEEGDISEAFLTIIESLYKPKGLWTSEFKDLVNGLSSLNSDEVRASFKQYSDYVISNDHEFSKDIANNVLQQSAITYRKEI